jgi:hypothetical protein
MIRVKVFNDTFNNISVISWLFALLMEEISRVTRPEVTSVTCSVRKYVLRMRNRKWRHILSSGAF